MLKAGVFLPQGAQVSPEPCFVDGYEDIQSHLGGLFDVVTTDMDTFGDHDLDPSQRAQFVGFVKDEINDEDEFNYLATALFKRPIHGGVVVLWGLNAQYETDGESYDIPEVATSFLMDDLVRFTADSYNQTMTLHLLTELAVQEGVCTSEQVYELSARLAECAVSKDLDGLREGEQELVRILEAVRSRLPEGFPFEVLDNEIDNLRRW